MSFPEPENSDGFTLIVNTTVQEGKLDEFLEHFWKVFKLVSADPECLSFEVFRYPGEPNKLKWIENWSKSKDWFFEVRFPSSYPSAQHVPQPLTCQYIIGGILWAGGSRSSMMSCSVTC